MAVYGLSVSEAVLGEGSEGIEEGLEVGLADERGLDTCVMEDLGDRWGIDREGYAIHPHPMGGRVLAGDDRRPRRHAHHRLRHRSLVADALGGESISHWGASHLAPIASEGVVALLVGGDEQDLAGHQATVSSIGASIWRLSSWSAR